MKVIGLALAILGFGILPQQAKAAFVTADVSSLRLDSETVRIFISNIQINYAGEDLFAILGVPRTGPNGEPIGIYPYSRVTYCQGEFGLPVGGNFSYADEDFVQDPSFFDIKKGGYLELTVSVYQDFVYEYALPNGLPSRGNTGWLSAAAGFSGMLPREIGQTVNYYQAPEPPTLIFALFTLMLLKSKRAITFRV